MDQEQPTDAGYLAFIRRTPVRRFFVPAWHPAPRPGTPGLLVLRKRLEADQPLEEGVTNAFRAGFVTLFVESKRERKFIERALDRPTCTDDGGESTDVTFFSVNRRPSTLPDNERLWLLHYGPAKPGWPHFLVSMEARTGRPETIRGRYLVNIYRTLAEVEERIDLLYAEMKAAAGLD